MQIRKPVQAGFSLIELLVVIAIIGILSAVLMANFDAAREDTKNKTVRTSLKEVQLALELYKSQNGRYPAAAGSPAQPTALVPEYIHALPDPDDSANTSCSYVYATDSGGSYYKYTAVRCISGASSASEGIKQDDEFARCPSSCPASGGCNPNAVAFYQSMAVYSIGGQCR